MKKNLLTILTFMMLSLFLAPNMVKAQDLESNIITNLSAKKDNTGIAIQFNMKKDIEFTNYSYITINYCFPVEDGTDCLGKYGASKLLADDTPLLDASDKGGENIYSKVNAGDTIFIYTSANEKDLFSNTDTNISDVYDSINEIWILIEDNDYDNEIITYDLESSKITSIEQSHDSGTELTNAILHTLGYGWTVYDIEEFTDHDNLKNSKLKLDCRFNITDEMYAEVNIVVLDYKSKTAEEIANEIKSKIENKELEMKLGTNNIGTDIFTSIKNNKNSVIMNSYQDDKILYSWVFNGAEMTSTDYEINLDLTIGASTNKEKIESKISNKDESLVLEFSYHGELPKGTDVKIFVGNKYNNQDLLTLWYYNDTEDKIEKIANDIVVEDGYVTLSLEHCSEYMLELQTENLNGNSKDENETKDSTDKDTSNNPQTSSLDVIMYVILAISSFVGMSLIVFINKRKKSKLA